MCGVVVWCVGPPRRFHHQIGELTERLRSQIVAKIAETGATPGKLFQMLDLDGNGAWTAGLACCCCLCYCLCCCLAAFAFLVVAVGARRALGSGPCTHRARVHSEG
jgi:hypothetical protein